MKTIKTPSGKGHLSGGRSIKKPSIDEPLSNEPLNEGSSRNEPLSEGGRLFELIKKQGLNQREFAEILGVSKSHISNILNGGRRISREVLEAIAQRYDVDLNELILGRKAATPETAYIELYRQEAAAGQGMEIEEYSESAVIPVPRALLGKKNLKTIKAVIVHGDSMTDEHIEDGDYVIFDTANKATECISVVSIDKTLLVKRVTYDGAAKTITLLSANKAYPPRTISGSDLETVKIEGKALVIIHKF